MTDAAIAVKFREAGFTVRISRCRFNICAPVRYVFGTPHRRGR